MKFADYLIQRLKHEGITKVFVVYGAANGDLIDAFTRVDGIDYVCAIHEQAAGFMAEAYAKTKGPFGVVIATSGPGGQNLVTPIANCFYDSVPVLFITGQVKRQFMRRNDAVRQVGFQETPIADIVKSITKHTVSYVDGRESNLVVDYESAIGAMLEGRPGPVLMDIPIDVQKINISEKFSDAMDSIHNQHVPILEYERFLESHKHVLKSLRGLIEESKRPYILIGGGYRRSEESLKNLDDGLNFLNIPASPTWNAVDIVTNDLDCYAGRVGTYGGDGRNFGIQNSDLLLCFGTRISGRITGGKPSTFARDARKILIDIDPTHINSLIDQGVRISGFIHADAQLFFEHFVRWMKTFRPYTSPSKHYSWLGVCKNYVRVYDPVDIHKDVKCEERGINPYLFMRRLSELAPSNAIIVSDCGGNQVIFAHAFRTKKGQRCITNNGNSPMGFSMAAAIGAAIANPDRPVWCIIGDGGMQMNIQELQTIFNKRLSNLKIFIINNGIYGITKAYQKVNFEGRSEACQYPNYTYPSFYSVTRAYGLMSYIINSMTLMRIKEQHFFDLEDCVVFDIICDDWHSYLPKISGWNTPIEDMEPYLPREEFKSNMIIDPLPGWEKHDYE